MNAQHHNHNRVGAPMQSLFQKSLVGAAIVLLATVPAVAQTPATADVVVAAASRSAPQEPAKAAKAIVDNTRINAENAAASLPTSINLQSAQQQEMLLAAPISRIAIADPSVADVLVMKPSKANGENGSLLLFGKRSGSTNLLIWYKGRVKAASVDLVVDGEDLKGTGLRSTGPVLAGTAPSMVAHAQASELIRQNLPEKAGKTLIDQSTVATNGMVQVDVKVVEFSKTALKQAGVNLRLSSNGQFRFGSFAPSGLQSFDIAQNTSIQTNAPIFSALNLLVRSKGGNTFSQISLMQSNGMARILAEPTLVALSGQSASFLAGGEIPIPVPQGLGSVAIQYKPFGIGLDLTPTVLSADRISLKVAPQASELDYTNAISINGVSVPAIRVRRTDTTIELGDGESFVIGGLVSKNMLSNVNKVPLLGDLPIIGAFFKSLTYQSEDKELLIVVTPHLARPIAKDAKLPPLPGGAEVLDPPVWTPYLLGIGSRNAPGLSQ